MTNVALGKRLLAEAGHSQGLSVTLNTSTVSTYGLEMAQALQQMVAPVGVDLQIKQWSPDTYWSEGWLKTPFFTSWYLPRPAPDILEALYQGYDNESRYQDPGAFKLVDAGLAATNQNQEMANYEGALTLVARESGTMRERTEYEFTSYGHCFCIDAVPVRAVLQRPVALLRGHVAGDEAEREGLPEPVAQVGLTEQLQVAGACRIESLAGRKSLGPPKPARRTRSRARRRPAAPPERQTPSWDRARPRQSCGVSPQLRIPRGARPAIRLLRVRVCVHGEGHVAG
jgi:hypothetical protein